MKELMAMVIGVVLGCDGCIASHARGAVRAGATKQEAAEVIGVSIMMHGGPATIYGARAYAAFCEFADEPPGLRRSSDAGASGPSSMGVAADSSGYSAAIGYCGESVGATVFWRRGRSAGDRNPGCSCIVGLRAQIS